MPLVVRSFEVHATKSRRLLRLSRKKQWQCEVVPLFATTNRMSSPAKEEAVKENEGTRPSRRIMWKRKNATVNNNMDGCLLNVSAVYQQSKAPFLIVLGATLIVPVCLSQQHVATPPLECPSPTAVAF